MHWSYVAFALTNLYTIECIFMIDVKSITTKNPLRYVLTKSG